MINTTLYDLVRALKFAKHAMPGRDESRYYLKGVALITGGDVARLEATDGHRIARVDLPCSLDPAQPGIAVHIMAQAAVELLLKGYGSTKPTDVRSATLVLSDDRRNLELAVGGFPSMTLALVEGTWPRVDRVIPTSDLAAGAVGLHSPYIKQAADALAQYSKHIESWQGCTLETRGPNDMICLSSGAAQAWICPMRL